MENIAQPNKENKRSAIKQFKGLLNRHFFDIMAFIIIILTITALIGLWRLKALTPAKEQIKLENIDQKGR